MKGGPLSQCLIAFALVASSWSTASFALTQEEMIQKVKVELSAYPSVTGGFADGVVTLGGKIESKAALSKIKGLLMDIEGVEEVRSSVTFNN
jgi:osmotically-inducible protein OsmY